MKKTCDETCCICGGKFSSHYEGKPYCNKHYLRMYLHGNPYRKQRQRTNEYEIIGDILIITTRKGEKIIADAKDAEKLKKHSWCISKTGYAVANINQRVTKLHRYLLDINDSNTIVDHKNHDRLDNRRENLRICSAKENAMNQRGNNGRKLPVGIRITAHGKFNARIMHDRKEIHLGNFQTLEEAVAARRTAEERYCGDFAQHKY